MLDPRHVPARVIIAVELNDVFDVERSIVGGVLWLTIPGSSAGLPIERLSKRLTDKSNWRALLDVDTIDIEIYEGDRWRSLDYRGRDWEVIKNVGKA